ncbi:MAG TPA: DUF4012 domain-containing protein [Ktedonobacterales bacterium]|nr:DUF4012 domain-containing protein [Ktedonobacterales bacterium]
MNQSLQSAVESAKRTITRQPGAAMSPGRRARQLTPRAVGIITFIAVLLLNSVAYGAIWGFNAYTTEHSARADLTVQETRLQALAAHGALYTPEGMAQARANLTSIDNDLAKLQNLLPLASVSPIEPEATLAHTLNLGRDVIGAALAGMQAEQALAPGLLALIGSVTHSASQASGKPLTLANVTVGQRALAIVSMDWSAALVERQSISPAALASLGDPRLGKLLAEFDKYAPTVTLGLSMASSALDWSPAALGLNQPFHALLFDMDTDELRATGGFLGNYALVTLSHGQVTSGVHLHDIYTIDCPNYTCPARPIPEQFSWYPLAHNQFGIRDSNLNPDFPASAGLASSLYQRMTGTRVDMVVAITPAIIEDIMRVTGPITVPQFNVKVTADTLAATIHYYHQNANLTNTLHINYTSLGTSIAKAFDVLLSQALMSRLSTLSSAQQAQLGALLVKAMAAKDVQIFVSDAHLENLLEQVGAAGQVLAPTYDNLMVVDTNDGGSYANADMRETMSDVVTLDATGGATHTLTITYDYLATTHVYTQKLQYDDFVRLIVPRGSGGFSAQGPCAPRAAVQSYHTVFGCQLRVMRGKQVTLTFTWYAPNTVATDGSDAYRLLIQRQAGAHVSMRVRLAPPAGGSLLPRDGLLTAQPGGLVWSADPLVANTTLAATVTS